MTLGNTFSSCFSVKKNRFSRDKARGNDAEENKNVKEKEEKKKKEEEKKEEE